MNKKNNQKNASSKDAQELASFLSQIAQQDMPEITKSLLDEIKAETMAEKRAELKRDVLTFNQRIQELVDRLRNVRKQEKAFLAEIKKVEGQLYARLQGTPMDELNAMK